MLCTDNLTEIAHEFLSLDIQEQILRLIPWRIGNFFQRYVIPKIVKCPLTFLFAAGNSRGDMEMMNTSVGLKLMLNPDDTKPNKDMNNMTAKKYWEQDPNCIIEYTRDVADNSKDWTCKKLGVKVNATTNVSDPAVVTY